VDSQVDTRTFATQIRYTAERLVASGVDGRVRLYQRNARDIGWLLDQDPPYDLVIFRGSIAHSTPETLESAMAAVSAQTRDDSTVLISDPLYNIPPGTTSRRRPTRPTGWHAATGRRWSPYWSGIPSASPTSANCRATRTRSAGSRR
jgi:hypothetical protein